MLGRKYWVESLMSEPSAKKRWAEGSTRFPVLGLLCRVHIIFQAKDARQISTPCDETSAPEAVRGKEILLVPTDAAQNPIIGPDLSEPSAYLPVGEFKALTGLLNNSC